MKFLISAGGTGGHIFPALALMEKIERENKSNELIYIGTNDRMEAKLIPDKGYKYYGIKAHSFNKNIFYDLKNAKDLYSSYKKCRKIIRDEKIDAVVTFGGYVTFPVILAAKKEKIPVFFHEQNVIPGKVNKLLQKDANAIFVSFEESKKYLPKANIIYSGNPTADRAITIKKHDKTKLGFNKNKKLIIIVMGSLGSKTVNKVIVDYLHNFNENDKEVLFIGGKHYYEEIKKEKFSSNVHFVEFYNDLSALMKDADLLITRAGASTLAEIISVKIPSIIIPSPFVANNHQYYNALDFKNNGIGDLLEEKDLTPETLKEKIDYIFKEDVYKSIKENLNYTKSPNSCDIIYKEIEKIVNK